MGEGVWVGSVGRVGGGWGVWIVGEGVWVGSVGRVGGGWGVCSGVGSASGWGGGN